MSPTPSHAAFCCFFSAIYGSNVCFFLLYDCCNILVCFLFASVSLPPSLSLLRDRLLLVPVVVFFPFLLYLRVSLLLFVFLFSSLLLHHYCHNFSDNSGLLPLSCAPHHLYIFRHLLLLPLTPPPLSSASGCQTLPSRPRGKAKAVDFSPHQAF